MKNKIFQSLHFKKKLNKTELKYLIGGARAEASGGGGAQTVVVTPDG